ncbi:hypothetical protein [Vibrio campbellii]|uniref:hypothetical protein n=1 Tax=Vibrio campbellii TaxID=680 RepID=UPI000A85905F|nr:hypothetical protein [Vibrio campbellii]
MMRERKATSGCTDAAATEEAIVVLFDYQDGSRGHHYLADYGGYLHVDGYEAYEKRK